MHPVTELVTLVDSIQSFELRDVKSTGLRLTLTVTMIFHCSQSSLRREGGGTRQRKLEKLKLTAVLWTGISGIINQTCKCNQKVRKDERKLKRLMLYSL